MLSSVVKTVLIAASPSATRNAVWMPSTSKPGTIQAATSTSSPLSSSATIRNRIAPRLATSSRIAGRTSAFSSPITSAARIATSQFETVTPGR